VGLRPNLRAPSVSMLDFNKNRVRIPPLRGVRGGLVLEVQTHNIPLPPLKGGIRSWFLLVRGVFVLEVQTHNTPPPPPQRGNSILVFVKVKHACPFGKHALTYKFLALITNRLLTRAALIHQYMIVNRAARVSKRFMINAKNLYVKACLPKGHKHTYRKDSAQI